MSELRDRTAESSPSTETHQDDAEQLSPEQRLARGDAICRAAIKGTKDSVNGLMVAMLLGAIRRAYSGLPDHEIGVSEEWMEEARALLREARS